MNLEEGVQEMSQLLEDKGKKHITPGCVWAIVKEVNWDEKTMVATGIEDELDYFDVQLGLGSFYRKPEVDTKVLLGVPGLQDSASFLIECEAYHEAIYVSGGSTFIMKEEGFIITQDDESLKVVLNDFIESVNNQNEEIERLSGELQKVFVVNGTTPAIPALQAIDQTLGEIRDYNDEVNNRLNDILVE